MDDLQKIRGLRKNLPGAIAQTAIPSDDTEAVPLYLGHVQIPVDLETRHVLAVGTTGAGKSQAIYDLQTRIRKRMQPAVVIDHSAEFLQRYYREGIDLIFNPFDSRSIGWSPFNEIQRVYDFDRMAKAIIPDIPGENQDWQIGAQMLLADILEALWKKGLEFRCNKAMIHFTTAAPTHGGAATPELSAELRHMLAKLADMPDGDVNCAPLIKKIRDITKDTPADSGNSLQSLLKGSSSARFFETGNEKQLAITLGIVGRYMRPFKFLKEGDFSISKYVRSFNSGKQKRWLFLSYTDASYQAIKTLFSIMVTCAIQAGLELSESKTRRFFFVLDEFSSLSKIDAVDDALVKLRKRGGVVIAGIQSTAQLIIEYGEHGAQTLLSCFGNGLYLRVADDQTAEKLSKMIGQVELWEQTYNESLGSSVTAGPQSSSSENFSSGWSKQKQVKDAVLPSEFTWLKDLTGFVRIAGYGDSVYRTTIPISNLPLIAKAEDTRPDVWLEPDSMNDDEYLLKDDAF